VLQLGLIPSHFSFLFLQIMHASRLGLGTFELPPAGASTVIWSLSRRLAAPESETMMVSGSVSGEVDMTVTVRWRVLLEGLWLGFVFWGRATRSDPIQAVSREFGGSSLASQFRTQRRYEVRLAVGTGPRLAAAVFRPWGRVGELCGRR